MVRGRFEQVRRSLSRSSVHRQFNWRYDQTNDEDDYDDYAQYQDKSPPRRIQNGAGRYEVTRPSLQARQAYRRAIPLEVFYNGNPGKSHKIAFSRKKYPLFHSFLKDCADYTKEKVVRVFKWPSKEEVVDASQIESEEISNLYVCADGKGKLLPRGYGGVGEGVAARSGPGDKHSRNSRNSRNTVRSKQSPTVRGANGRSGNRPLYITVTEKSKIGNKQSMFLDPKSSQTFEDLLRDVTEMLGMKEAPCACLVSRKSPNKMVESISGLRSAANYGDQFWAYTKEEKESSRDSSPMQNGHKQRGHQQNGYHDQQRQSNGHVRQSDTYEDSRGREFRRHEDTSQRNQPDGYESSGQSPDRRRGHDSPIEQYSPPPRDNRRGEGGQETARNGRYVNEDESEPRRTEYQRNVGYRQKQQQQQQQQQKPVRKSSDDRRNDRNEQKPQDNNRRPDREEDDDLNRRNNRRDNDRNDDDDDRGRGQDRRENGREDEDTRRNRRDTNDDDDDRRQKRNDSDDDDNREEDSPSPTVMRKRIEDMDVTGKDLDRDVDF